MYSAQKDANGNYVIYKDGVRITTGSAAILPNYGLSETQLTSSAPAPTAIGTTTTQAASTPTYGSATPTPSSGTTTTTQSAPVVSSSQLQPVTDPNTAPGFFYAPAGYNLSNANYITINGQFYQVSGNMIKPVANPGGAFATNAKDISAYSTSPAPTTGTTAATGTLTTGTTGAPPPDISSILNGSNLSADQKAAIQSIYNAVATNDQDYASKISQAMSAAMQYSDPYFKSQIKLALDALDRGLQAQTGDLSFKETQLQNSLTDLQNNTQASKDYLSLEEQQQLKDLEKKYQGDLENTQNSLAARGLTASSVRSKSEQMLSDSYGDMRQSADRQLAYQTGNLDRTLASAVRDTTQQSDYYKTLAAQGKLDLLRKYEGQLGSTTLSGAGYNTLGGIGGDIPRQQLQDATSFANSYVF